jgi:hypothetical protein
MVSTQPTFLRLFQYVQQVPTASLCLRTFLETWKPIVTMYEVMKVWWTLFPREQSLPSDWWKGTMSISSLSMLVYQNFYNKESRIWGLTTKEILCLRVLKFTSSKSRCHLGDARLWDSGLSFFCLFLALVAAVNPQCLLCCRCVSIISVSIFTWHSSFVSSHLFSF